MQIVIDIPNFEWLKNEKDFKEIIKEYKQGTEFDEAIRNALINGTPLPKGHGRLKDVDAFLQRVREDMTAYTRDWDASDVLDALDKTYAPTVVEAELPLTDTERSFLAKVKNDMSRINKLSKSKQRYGNRVGE